MPDRASVGLPDGAATYLAFDFGEKRIGVAVGQSVSGTAAPLCTIPASPLARRWRAISELVEQWRPAALIVGLSYREDGSENPITAKTLRFCRQLEDRYHLPVFTIDETLTTAASRSLFFARPRRKSVRFEQVKDEMAAQLILQTWFEIHRQVEKFHA
jgi:putative Holliday junction resolvase